MIGTFGSTWTSRQKDADQAYNRLRRRPVILDSSSQLQPRCSEMHDLFQNRSPIARFAVKQRLRNSPLASTTHFIHQLLPSPSQSFANCYISFLSLWPIGYPDILGRRLLQRGLCLEIWLRSTPHRSVKALGVVLSFMIASINLPSFAISLSGFRTQARKEHTSQTTSYT